MLQASSFGPHSHARPGYRVNPLREGNPLRGGNPYIKRLDIVEKF